MSTATTQHELDEIQARDEPSNIFRRYIFEDPSICSNCFRRLRQNGRRTIWATRGTDQVDKDPVPEYANTDRDSYGEHALYPLRTVCEDCGSISGRADSQSLSRRQAIGRCEPLADRLAELGEPVDADLLKREVGQLKSTEKFASHDTLCFEAAVTGCLRHARSR